MKRFGSLLIVVVVLLLCTALQCDEPDWVVVMLENQTSETLYVINVNKGDAFENIFKNYSNAKIVLPHEKLEVTATCPPNHFSGKIINVFYVFKESTFKTYTKEEIVEHNIYDKRYELTYQQLEEMDFTVVYTGN